MCEKGEENKDVHTSRYEMNEPSGQNGQQGRQSVAGASNVFAWCSVKDQLTMLTWVYFWLSILFY